MKFANRFSLSNIGLRLVTAGAFAMLLCISVSRAETPSSSEYPKAVLKKFFSNYALIAQGWPTFTQEQSKLLSPGLVTLVRDHLGAHRYAGIPGYFDSLGDWSKSFATAEDFRTDYRGRVGDRFVVALHGTLLLNRLGRTVRIPEGKHCWNEVFSLTPDGKIATIEVDMNLGCL